MSESLSSYIRKRKVANKSTWTSVIVNFFLVIFQIVVGLFSKSSGLIADGLHTLADMFSDLLVLITSKKSLNPPDDDHNYGHYRYENNYEFHEQNLHTGYHACGADTNGLYSMNYISQISIRKFLNLI